MTAPFNLTSSVQGGSFLKASKSQHKIDKVSTSQGSRGINLSSDKKSLKYQTNLMFQFGKIKLTLNIFESIKRFDKLDKVRFNINSMKKRMLK